jgi:glutamine---fructose-6-phosphate transaminase (isomerizing)
MNDASTGPKRPGFDPEAPLPGPPQPWVASSMPRPRGGPPFAMSEMIAAEPALAERLLRRLDEPAGPTARLATMLAGAARADTRIRVVGCGTSEHAAMATARILADALGRAGLPRGRVRSVQALEAWLDDVEGAALTIAISHEGGTWATNGALEAARDRGDRTALVTVGGDSPAAELADVVVTTGEQDQSWCHTVGYLSPVLAAVSTAGHLAGPRPDPSSVRALLSAAVGLEATAEAAAAALAGVERLIVVASGADGPAARELALKVEEGAHLPATARDLETLLHGHLAATDARTGLVLILADRARRTERLDRAQQVLAAAAVIGGPVAAIVATEVGSRLAGAATPAGRLTVPEAPDLTEPGAALLATAPALQLLTERLARARGTDPDTLRRTDERYREAAAQAE